jgi:hypothetical protein
MRLYSYTQGKYINGITIDGKFCNLTGHIKKTSWINGEALFWLIPVFSWQADDHEDVAFRFKVWFWDTKKYIKLSEYEERMTTLVNGQGFEEICEDLVSYPRSH